MNSNRLQDLPPPFLYLDWSHAGRVEIHFGEWPLLERFNSMPVGAAGAKIWWRVIKFAPGARCSMHAQLAQVIPQNWRHLLQWTHLCDALSSPHKHIIPIALPVVVEYRAQWFGNAGELGVLCEPVRATITP